MQSIRTGAQYISSPTPAPQAPAQPPVEAPVQPSEDFVDINVPMRIPAALVTPDAQGNVPLQSYQPKLVPANAIITSQEEVQSLVETVRKQTLPAGTHPEINDSKAGARVDAAKNLVVKLAGSAGSLGAYSLLHPAGALSYLTVPATIGAPMAVVGGAIGTIAGLDQAKSALNRKGYFEDMKAQGVQTVALPQPVRTKEGIQVQMVELPIDKAINMARDQAIVGGMMSASSTLMTAAGLTANPALAVASIAVSVGSVLYALHDKIADLAVAIWHKITGDKGEAAPPPEATAPAQPQKPQEAAPTTLTMEQPQ